MQARAFLWTGRTDIARLVHDAADALPGLQVDRMGTVAVVQAYVGSWQERLPQVAEVLLESQPGLRSVRAMVRLPGGRSSGPEHRAGLPLEDEFSATEDGLAFRVRAADESLNAGIFPDARLARRRVRELSAGQAVLNLFSYAGGFTVAALAGGASAVDHVDANAKMAGWGARNVLINGLSARACRFIVDDAAHFTARMARQGRQYGLVVLDPPTFGRSTRGTHTNQALADVCADALRVLAPGGRLLFSNNTRSLAAADLWSHVQAASAAVGLGVTWEDTIHAGPDFPRLSTAPELDRFKMVVARRH